ncbi:MAG: helix-turn-helix domain-containing protein [Candidatus Hydrogenedentes bacterium]|nr:helix-turn-helix domain-containing protein [Candidatus Hydrogenedentota bacterium]
MNTITFPGTALAEARKAQGKTLQDVYEDIHVPMEHIHALEGARLHELPGVTYGLGFLRTYCEYLGLDPAPYVDQYRLFTAVHPPRRISIGGLPQLEVPSRWMGEALTWGTLCAVLLLGWVTYSMIMQPWVESSETRVEAGTFEVAPETLWDVDTGARN